MKKKEILFVYDCDGTLQSLPSVVWILAKKSNLTNLSCKEFKEKQPEQYAMIPGMADLIKYTAEINWG